MTNFEKLFGTPEKCVRFMQGLESLDYSNQYCKDCQLDENVVETSECTKCVTSWLKQEEG